MFLHIEANMSVNLSLIDRLEWNHRECTVRAFVGNMTLCGDSKILYAFLIFGPGKSMVLPPFEIPKPEMANS